MDTHRARFAVVAALVLASLAGIVFATLLALREPIVDLHLRATDDGAVVTTDRWVTHAPLDWQAAAWLDNEGRRHAIDAMLLTEEPDRLDSYAEWNSVLVRAGELWTALARGSLRIVDAAGQVHVFDTRARELADLPWTFWTQLGVGTLALGACALVWRLADDRAAAGHFLAGGIAFFLAALTSSVYAARELALDETTFRVLARLNHASGVLMPAAIAVLEWIYPSRLAGRRMIVAIYGLAIGSFLLAQLRWPDAMPTVVYGTQALLYLLVVAGCVRQWQAGRTDPMKRSILSAYLLALFSGAPICGALVLVPQLTGRGESVSQTMMFVSFLPGYVGLAAGVARYRLVDLSRAWYRAWSFFLGSIALLGAYLLLHDGFGLARNLALAAAAGFVGWVYFPLRRWLARRLRGRDGELPQHLLPDALAALAAVPDLTQINEAWRRFLEARYRCLGSEAAAEDIEVAHIVDHGLALAVPGLFGTAFVLRYPDRGRRLFQAEDRHWIALLHRLARLQVGDRLACQRAARDQRAWLKRELGEVLHEPLPVSVNTRLGRLHEAIDDRTRTPIERTLSDLEAAARTRCATAGIRLDWRNELHDLGRTELPLRCGVALERALSEAIGNALRHGRAGVIEVVAEIHAERLRLRVADDGDGGDPSAWLPGRGLHGIATRIAEIGGDATWHGAARGVAVCFDIPV